MAGKMEQVFIIPHSHTATATAGLLITSSLYILEIVELIGRITVDQKLFFL